MQYFVPHAVHIVRGDVQYFMAHAVHVVRGDMQYFVPHAVHVMRGDKASCEIILTIGSVTCHRSRWGTHIAVHTL